MTDLREELSHLADARVRLSLSSSLLPHGRKTSSTYSRANAPEHIYKGDVTEDDEATRGQKTGHQEEKEQIGGRGAVAGIAGSGDTIVPVNKTMLALRSQFFRTLFACPQSDVSHERNTCNTYSRAHLKMGQWGKVRLSAFK